MKKTEDELKNDNQEDKDVEDVPATSLPAEGSEIASETFIFPSITGVTMARFISL